MNSTSLDIARVVQSKPHVHFLAKPEAIAFGDVGVANLNVQLIHEQNRSVLVPTNLQYHSTEDVKYFLTSYYATVTLVVEFVSGDKKQFYLSSAISVSPLHFVSTAHAFIPPSENYQLGSIYYTYLKDIAICSDWQDEGAYGKLTLVSNTEEIDKKFPGYAMAGQFEWDVCPNDIAVLIIEQKLQSEIFDNFVLLPKPCYERRLGEAGNEIVVSGCAVFMSKPEYEKDYGQDYSLVQMLAYEDVKSYFFNFDKTVMSFGATVMTVFPDKTVKRLATHIASALGGMSGGPLTVLDVLPHKNRGIREPALKKSKWLIRKDELPVVGYFSGLHLGGFPNFGKNVALPVDDPSFI